MAEVRTKDFKTLAADTLSDAAIQEHLKTLYSGFNQGRLQQAAATPNWEELRDRARQIKAHTVENLDHYLSMAADNVEKAGGKVFFAKDSDAATNYVIDLAKQKGVRSVIKGKSMLSEEMDLNRHLAKQEIEAVETDLGEYLVQLAGQTPYHIIVPAIHMSKSDVNELFHENPGGRFQCRRRGSLRARLGANFAKNSFRPTWASRARISLWRKRGHSSW